MPRRSSKAGARGAPAGKPFDPVVKIGLTVLVGGFMLIAGGMVLSRPDRTIPPFSVGWQEGAVVAVHVPPWTGDQEITALLQRFRDVGTATGDFRSLKVRPTTPEDPMALYREVIIYIFSDSGWTAPDVLHRYVDGNDSGNDAAFRLAFQQAARGGFLYRRGSAKGWLGPVPASWPPAQAGRTRSLFDDAPLSSRARNGRAR